MLTAIEITAWNSKPAVDAKAIMICEVSFVILILRLLGFFIPSNVRVEPQVAAKRAPVGSHELIAVYLSKALARTTTEFVSMSGLCNVVDMRSTFSSALRSSTWRCFVAFSV